MRRAVWFALGAAVAVVVVVKGAQLLRKATPEGVREQVADASADLGQKTTTFVRTLTSAMAERETELRAALGIDGAEATERPAAAPARRAAS
ncbi:MAG TPA: hypothetical protein VLS51_09000 [Propionibacteriaceae bacterium]|nr:hypothetical protein [Propionibacteriaceae bacterium]